ncbi:MAG TPA: hypothetical protein VI258_11010 [Rhodanobacteraceae bacterium]
MRVVAPLDQDERIYNRLAELVDYASAERRCTVKPDREILVRHFDRPRREPGLRNRHRRPRRHGNAEATVTVRQHDRVAKGTLPDDDACVADRVAGVGRNDAARDRWRRYARARLAARERRDRSEQEGDGDVLHRPSDFGADYTAGAARLKPRATSTSVPLG